jgi:endogenous inhibitor of DNA gyrase (YacG/DUF329 family)
MPAMSTVKQVCCPQCGARVEWTPASTFRPFCSQRCKLIDLGAWASESYRVPLTSPAEASDSESEATPFPPRRES